MFLYKCFQNVFIQYTSCRIIRIAYPYQVCSRRYHIQCVNNLYLVVVKTASIGIFTESRHQDGRIFPPEGLGYQINGFRSAISHTNLLPVRQMNRMCQCMFKRIRLRFGITSNTFHPMIKMLTQTIMIYMIIYI